MDQQRTPGAVINPETEELSEEEQAKQDWAAINRFRARNAHLDPDEGLAFITQIVEEVRQEMYEESLRETEGGR